MIEIKMLVIQARAADPHAFQALVVRYQDMAVGYAQSILGDFHLAEDVAQDAFVEAFRILPQLRNPDAFAGWFRQIVFKHCDRLSRKRRIPTTSLDEGIMTPSDAPDPEGVLNESSMKAAVISALQALPHNQRIVAILHYISNYTHQDISKFLNIPVTTVNYRLQRARAQMKERLEKMAKDMLHDNAPSKDSRFADAVARMIQPDEMKTSEYIWGSVETIDGNEGWRLMCACVEGDLTDIRELIDRDPRLVNTQYWYQSPIHMAVRYGHTDVVSILLDAGADAAQSVSGVYTWDVLLAMAKDRAHDNIYALLVHALHKRFRYMSAFEAVGDAILTRDRAGMETLLNETPELACDSDTMGNTGIHWAVMTRQMDLVDYFLDKGVDMEAKRADGMTALDVSLECRTVPGEGFYLWFRNRDAPLHEDTMHDYSSMTGYLLARGAEYSLSAATALGDLGRVKEVLKQDPQQAGRLNASRRSPLSFAAEYGYTAVVACLLDHGADPNKPERSATHGRALHEACSYNHLETARLLLDRGADINAAVDSSGDCFEVATYRGHEAIILLLKEYGVEDKEAGQNRFTIACETGDADTVKQKLENDPGLARDTRGFDLACRGNYRDIVERMLEYNPDLLNKGNLPAAAIPILEMLLERGANPNMTNWIGVTPLHTLAEQGDTERAAILIKHGADLDSRDSDYFSTPLAWAARDGQKEMVIFLLGHGARAELAEDPSWATPLAWAEKRGHADIAKLLRAR